MPNTAQFLAQFCSLFEHLQILKPQCFKCTIEKCKLQVGDISVIEIFLDETNWPRLPLLLPYYRDNTVPMISKVVRY
jgi:hypothetical protein